jgi:hypothetical protein
MAQLTEAEYRALPIDSYSTIKVFLEDRKKYYKAFILNEPVKEEKSDALTFGNLVDCLRLTPDQFESKFTMSISQIPTGQYLKFCDQLLKYTMYAVNRDTGEITRTMDDMMLDAYNACKYDRDNNIVDFKRDSFETAKAKFLNPESGLETYYKQCRDSVGKEIIDLTMLENAQRLVTNLSENFATRDIINLVSGEDIKVFNQFPIVGELGIAFTKSVPYPLKCLVDKLVINRLTKEIDIYDLKTCWDNEQEFIHNYFKYKYYIQGGVYFYLVEEWRKKEKSLADYKVNYPKFIVTESTSYKNPLIYYTTMENFIQGMKGFRIKSRYYPGVIKAVTDLQWHKENAVWTISKDNHIANGIVNMPIFE